MKDNIKIGCHKDVRCGLNSFGLGCDPLAVCLDLINEMNEFLEDIINFKRS